jgi:hypothetical protein
MRATSSSLTLLIWSAYSNPSRSGFEPLISRAFAGWQLGAPVFFTSAGLMGARSNRPLSC